MSTLIHTLETSGRISVSIAGEMNSSRVFLRWRRTGDATCACHFTPRYWALRLNGKMCGRRQMLLHWINRNAGDMWCIKKVTLLTKTSEMSLQSRLHHPVFGSLSLFLCPSLRLSVCLSHSVSDSDSLPLWLTVWLIVSLCLTHSFSLTLSASVPDTVSLTHCLSFFISDSFYMVLPLSLTL